MPSYICSFGGSFLLMVFLNFFLSENKGHYWIPLIKNNIITKKLVIMLVVTFFL